MLVNNAGVQIIGRSPELEWERQEQMLKLDLLTPLKLTRALLPGMVRRGEGTIVDVASVAALAPTPYMAGYNAAKAGLAAASESMRAELKRVGVHVVTVYPGPIDTAMGTAGYAAYEPSPALQRCPSARPRCSLASSRGHSEKEKARVIYPRMYAVTRWFPGPTRWFLDFFTPQPRSAAPRSNG